MPREWPKEIAKIKKKKKNSKNNKQKGRRIWYPKLPYYNIQSMQFPIGKLCGIQRNKKEWHIHRKKKEINQNCPKESQTLDLLDKD